MNKFYLFLIILAIFIIFIFIQIYFYYKKYQENQNTIRKMESFENTLGSMEKDYLLDDKSMERLLEDYNSLKNNV
jgi:hypothetical protein